MIKEYSTITEVNGPLIIVNKIVNVKYDELVEIELSDGEKEEAKSWKFPRIRQLSKCLRELQELTYLILKYVFG